MSLAQYPNFFLKALDEPKYSIYLTQMSYGDAHKGPFSTEKKHNVVDSNGPQ